MSDLDETVLPTELLNIARKEALPSRDEDDSPVVGVVDDDEVKEEEVREEEEEVKEEVKEEDEEVKEEPKMSKAERGKKFERSQPQKSNGKIELDAAAVEKARKLVGQAKKKQRKQKKKKAA